LELPRETAVNDQRDNLPVEVKSRPRNPGYTYLVRWLGVSFVVFAVLVMLQLKFAGETQPDAPAVPAANLSAPKKESVPARDTAKPTESSAPAPPTTSDAKTFKSLTEMLAFQKQLGYLFAGRFDDAWPATVVGEETAMNEIHFRRANGTLHHWGRVEGYRLKLVRLQTPTGGEAIVLFRSIEKQ
jgi:hypothetical protein